MDDRPPYLTTEEWEGRRQAPKAARNGPSEHSPEFSEDALALRFADLHAGNLRYVALWGKWLTWTGTHWEFENTLAVFDMARKICREAACQCKKLSEAQGLSRAKVVAAVETLARSDRRIAATTAQWDGEPSNFNAKE